MKKGRPRLRSEIEWRQQRLQYARDHPDQMRRYKQRWRANNPGKGNRASREEHRRLRHEIIAGYGGVCVHCGDDRWQVLTIDHINGGGTQHRKEVAKTSGGFYRWLRDQGFPRDEYRLLCYNCNCARAHAGGLPPVPFESSLALLGGWGG